MSEYQCYEFVTLDQRLSAREMAALRAVSSRADISPTRFWNEYHWGDLKADPAKLLARYFDAHFYFASWGTRRLMLRLPARNVDVRALAPYFVGDRATLKKVGAFVTLDFCSDEEAYDDESERFEGGFLASLTPLRAQILAGDMSAPYVAWLAGVQGGDVRDAVREPPVPPNLADLTPPTAALVELMRIDPDLLAAAAEGSRSIARGSKQLRAWIKRLSAAEKNRWLQRALDDSEPALGAELRAAFQKQHAAETSMTGRTAGELRARANELREARIARTARKRVVGRKLRGSRA